MGNVANNERRKVISLMIMRIGNVDYEGLTMEQVKEKLKDFLGRNVNIGDLETGKEYDFHLMNFDELEGAFFQW